jgi:hypothetical protein
MGGKPDSPEVRMRKSKHRQLMRHAEQRAVQLLQQLHPVDWARLLHEEQQWQLQQQRLRSEMTSEEAAVEHIRQAEARWEARSTAPPTEEGTPS